MPTDDRSGFRLDLSTDDERRLRAAARLRAIQERNRTRYEAHPWPFLAECVWTLDQATGRERPIIDDLPDDHQPGCDCQVGGCSNYLQHIVNRWFTEKRIDIPKSRRMRVTWAMIACHTWLARFRHGTMVGIGSRKRGNNDSEGSAELVKRCEFILNHLPRECPGEPHIYNLGRIQFPRKQSEIVAVAQGADQMRQYTFTAVLMDECAFWERAGETYNASLPTLEGGGRLTMVSSANPGFFKMHVHDELHSAGFRN